jgi:putative transposase
VLQRLARKKTGQHQLVERCNIVLLSADGEQNIVQGKRLNMTDQRVRRWRLRWAVAEVALAQAESQGVSADDLENLIVELLTDHPRPGAPSTFSAVQLTAIMALACEPPQDSGLPVSHWTSTELAQEAIKRGIVEKISPRHVSRFLAERTCDRTKANIG